jgi:UDP-N-acetylmuramoyl-tripeptide--D-alanyl-D-alanine ligase
MLTTADLFEALSNKRPAGANEVITDAVIDSRRAISGAVFVAICGERADGHAYVQDAFERGAVVSLIEHEIETSFPVFDFRQGQVYESLAENASPVCLLVNNTVDALQQIARFWRRKLSLRVVGITGSVGKSTTKEVIAEVLGQRYRILKNLGNFNNEIGLPLTLLRLSEGYEAAVLEMGFYVPGEIALLCDIARPQIGVVTNIGTVHAERAGTQEIIARGKAELVQSLPNDGVAVLNHDDPWVRGMADQTSARIFWYGLTPEADLWADDVIGLGLDGIQFRMHYRDESLDVRIPMIGRHSVQTALRAAAVGIIEGLGWQEILDGLRMAHAQLRLVAVRTQYGALLLDDTYNASPESTLAALNLLSELDGRRIAVLGDMLELGQYEAQGHEEVGLRAAQIVNELVTVGERARIIANSAQTAGLPARRITQLKDSEDAIIYLRSRLAKNDVVLVKGSRSMRMEKIVGALEARS